MTGTYEIIYADPPWRYSAKKVQGAAENHYPTMSIDRRKTYHSPAANILRASRKSPPESYNRTLTTE